MIQMLIKADTVDAALAVMAARGLTPVGVSTKTAYGVFSNTTDDKLQEVARWFCEDFGPAPFPQGTLLHYNPEFKDDH